MAKEKKKHYSRNGENPSAILSKNRNNEPQGHIILQQIQGH
ncbi:Uncharacterised protein [Legionella steigerwaltii]|uniref:Uncharacterized protein n=1 Tax=Legionella steigerwaltii TaxID=460 RepID=A0A378L3T7_9GAMM|nr:hypothetical protein [Legionella steigerwaltii]STY21444.1 Uncharacterised protein [Legionella steigerwaltii]